MVTIRNDRSSVTVSEIGAEIQNITSADGTEYLWNGDPAYWSGRAPILFPICGALKDGQYTYEGKTYSLQKHGFTRNRPFTVERQTPTEVTFLTAADDGTRAVYPFEFELRITFSLHGKTLRITDAVKNCGEKPLYCSLGAHEAYACPEGIEAYDVIFEKPETLDTCTVEGVILSGKTKHIGDNVRVLPMKPDYFEEDALIFKHLRSASVKLQNRETERGVEVSFPDFGQLLLWQVPGAPYLCVEPWCGLPDTPDCDGRLEHKAAICRVSPADERTFVHSITLL